nr:oligosaccharide flippase family protein [uncultured Acetatifactor sp.]
MFINKYIIKYEKMSTPVKAAFWYTICNVLNKGVALLSTPIFTRILTEEQYGTFAIFQSWYSILIIFTSLNIFLAGYKKGLLLYKDDIAGFTSSQLGLTAALTVGFFVIYLMSPNFWRNVFGLNPSLMVAMFIELFTMPALELWMAKEQFEYKYKKTVAVSVLLSVFCIGIAVVAVMYNSHKLEARVYSDVIVKATIAGSIMFLIYSHGKKFYKKEYWKFSLNFNIPLIPHYLSNYVLSQSDRLMIGKMVGTAEAAFYSVAYSIATMMILVTSAVNNALTPYIYKSINENNTKKIKKNMTPIMLFIAILSIISMAFAPEIILVFAGRKYLDAVYVIPPVSASVYFIFVYSMYSTIEYYYQKTKHIAIATSLSASLNLLLNYCGIKLFGYIAAGYTTLICYVILALIHYVLTKKIIENNLSETSELYDSHIIFLIGIGLILIMILMTMTYKLYVIRYAIIVAALSGIYLTRGFLIDVLLRTHNDSNE